MKRPRRLSTVGRYAFAGGCFVRAGYYFTVGATQLALSRVLLGLARAVEAKPRSVQAQ